jgi:hypothetical protein
MSLSRKRSWRLTDNLRLVVEIEPAQRMYRVPAQPDKDNSAILENVGDAGSSFLYRVPAL